MAGDDIWKAAANDYHLIIFLHAVKYQNYSDDCSLQFSQDDCIQFFVFF